MPIGISQKKKKSRGSGRDVLKGPKRTSDEILRDRADIARLRLSGKTLEEIAAEITRLRDYSISLQMIAVDLKSVRAEWLKSSVDDYEKTRMIELARLDQEEAMALEGWETSKLPKKKQRTRTGTNDGKPFEEFMEEQSEVREGNPAFLARLESIRLRRCSILGFEAHQRSQNINAAIDTLLAAGYVVSLPTESTEDGDNS